MMSGDSKSSTPVLGSTRYGTWNWTPVFWMRRSRFAEPREVGTSVCGRHSAHSFSRTGRTKGDGSYLETKRDEGGWGWMRVGHMGGRGSSHPHSSRGCIASLSGRALGCRFEPASPRSSVAYCPDTGP